MTHLVKNTLEDKWQALFDYIDHHLYIELSVEHLSDVANISKYHFHRLFLSHFGMTCFSYISQLRNKKAAFQLAFRKNKKVIDVALSSNYESSEAFSRAFKKKVGQSPREFRQQPDWLSCSQYTQSMEQLRRLQMNKTTPVFDVKIVDFEKIKVAVFEHRGAARLLGNSIRQFIEWRKANRLPPAISRTFNLVYDDPRVTADECYRFDLCASVASEVENNLDGIVNKVIPKGRCAVIRHVGSDELMSTAIEYLYSDWLEISGEALRDFPLFFERVSFFPDVAEAEMITDIYLPIK